MIQKLEVLRKERSKHRNNKICDAREAKETPETPSIHESYECVAVHVSPDLGERIMLSGERSLLDEVKTLKFTILIPFEQSISRGFG